jgi:hypothetical protein
LFLITSTVLAVLVGGIGVGAAHADASSSLYVDDSAANCSDSGPGSQAVPFCQIQAAANLATAGDTVSIAYGTSVYKPVTITSSGTAGAPITFTANGRPRITATTTPAISFVGARFIDLNGFNAASTGEATVTVDGASADLSLTRMQISAGGGWGMTSASGAHDITLADIAFSRDRIGAVSAVGTTGLIMAGDTADTVCGNAISLTGGSSGNIENTVANAWTVNATCPLTGTPAEITVDASSAAGVTADYNAVNPAANGVDYSWAGTDYSTSAEFRTATGHGVHDIDQSTATLSGMVTPQEHSPLINSADANAPGELATDFFGRPRTYDPLVPSTGTGPGDYDRGAFQFQDPLYVGLTGVHEGGNLAPFQATAQAVATNPWNDQLIYSFDFGDGSATTTPSASASATHEYTTASPLYGFHLAVTVTTQTSTTRSTWMPVVVASVPLTVSLKTTRSIALPDAASFNYTSTSTWPILSSTMDFGDGSKQTLSTASGSFTHTYAKPGTYYVSDVIDNGSGPTSYTSAQVTVGAAFVPLHPARILDTRNGTGAPRAQVGPGGVIRLKVAGAGGIPATGVAAVAMNVTDADATAASYVAAYADGTTRPVASNLNFRAGQVNPNLITVPVSATGYVDLYNSSGRVDLIADVQGYYTTSSNTSDLQSGFIAAAPTRVLDTRNGTGAARGTVGPRHTAVFKLPSLPSNATAATLSITETGATAGGFVTAYCGTASTPPSTTSNLNFSRGQTTSNLAVVPVCDGGYVSLYNSTGNVSLIADLQGYYSSTSGNPFVPVAPERLLDTRIAAYGTGTLEANSTVALGTGVWNSEGAAALVNMTGTGPSTATWLSAFGSGAVPASSNLDLAPGETRPVLATVPMYNESNTWDGLIHLHNNAGTVDLIVDLEGYFS